MRAYFTIVLLKSLDNLSRKKTKLRRVPRHSTFADDSTIQQAVEEAGH